MRPKQAPPRKVTVTRTKKVQATDELKVQTVTMIPAPGQSVPAADPLAAAADVFTRGLGAVSRFTAPMVALLR